MKEEKRGINSKIERSSNASCSINFEDLDVSSQYSIAVIEGLEIRSLDNLNNVI
jgi:hypothetical protein